MSEPSSPAICFDVEAFRREAEAAHHLLVEVEQTHEAPPSSLEQHLASCVDEALERRGALRRSASVPDELCECLADQLYRARLLGFDGLSVELQCLSAFARDAILDGEGSAGLRRWFSAARSGRVKLALGPRVLALRVHDEPVELRSWFDTTDERSPAAVVELPVGESDAGIGNPGVDALDAAAFDDALDLVLGFDRPVGAEPVCEQHDVAPGEVTGDDSHDLHRVETLDEPGETHAEELREESDDDVPGEIEIAGETTGTADAVGESRIDAGSETPITEPAAVDGTASVEPVAEAESGDDIVVRPRRVREDEIASRQIPLFVQANDDDASSSEVSREVALGHQRADWCDALSRADGATSFQALEDLFVTAYAPLQEAIAADPERHASQREVLERWATEFETCYRRAFEHLRTSRRRPQMVFDAPKMAFNLSRVHDAKAFQLVLVDAFRFDIGQRVYDKLRLQLSGHAECVQRGVLWSPLPSNTSAGLELLARGPDGLRDLRGEIAEAKVVSIKDARRLRKLRAGPHSLFKLDAIQALLEPGRAWSPKGLDQLAAEVAVSCGRFVRQQAPGSLVFMFGDHGFRLSDGGHGGASPSEVLVPYQAWRLLEGSGSVAAE